MHEFNFSEGELLLVNKPLRWTSFDVVEKLKRTLGIRKIKIGHAGTLDPLATGLLMVCTGKMTKSIDSFQAQEKEYTGEMTFGATRPSYDMESDIDAEFDLSEFDVELLQAATLAFTGEIEQVSPTYSALKINGERAYKMVRRGEVPVMKSRKVIIDHFSVNTENFPLVSFRVVCSKGTYIRSLVHDLAASLGSGAYLSELTRTRIGDYSLVGAWNLEELIGEIRLTRGMPAAKEPNNHVFQAKRVRAYHHNHAAYSPSVLDTRAYQAGTVLSPLRHAVTTDSSVSTDSSVFKDGQEHWQAAYSGTDTAKNTETDPLLAEVIDHDIISVKG